MAGPIRTTAYRTFTRSKLCKPVGFNIEPFSTGIDVLCSLLSDLCLCAYDLSCCRCRCQFRPNLASAGFAQLSPAPHRQHLQTNGEGLSVLTPSVANRSREI